MSRPRVFPDADALGQCGVFHCLSRIVDKSFYMEDAVVREKFVEIMRGCEALCQVQVLTYCVMSNHFHILVRVPEKPEGFDLPLEEVMELWGGAVGDKWRMAMEGQFEIYRGNGCEQVVEEWRQKVMARMFSLSEFMKLVKQRFTQWYDGSHGRTGTLWESRFTSVIVEDEERALRTMAAYIDLNPVRAGMVEDPADYRWCGYAALRQWPVVSGHGPALNASRSAMIWIGHGS